jgi:hypothetical protein
MRIVALALFSIAVLGGGIAFAQGDPAARERAEDSRQKEEPEEVVVRGRRIGELRAEVEDAREHAYELFNDLNGNDEFDVHCHKESRSGTNVPQVVCRAQFENRISAAAAREYMSTLFTVCQPNANGFLDTQACLFGGPGVSARASAQGVEGQAPLKRDQMTEEIFRVARENDEFAQAILDWYEASQQYDAARRRREER